MLDKILNKKWFVDDCFERDSRINSLEQRDKNFLRAMVLTTLRHKGEIDHFLHQFSRDFDNVLRVAIAQLKFMGLPDHAVVNEMVNLAENKPFVNAVLRKSSVEKIDKNIKLDFPKWMLGSWKMAYGDERLAQMLPLMLEEPPLDITLKEGQRSKVEGQSYFSLDLRPMTLPNGSIRVSGAGNITELNGFAEGEWWVQDASSTMVVPMLGDVKGKRVLDMCAAPGGKTAQLCDAGAQVTAIDESERRTKRLRENMERLKFSPEVICVDARNYKAEPFDAILLDAPCTATGTIRKNPEILHSRTPEDVKEMVKIQNELINVAYNLLKPNGILAYSVCSLQYEEGEGLMKKLDPKSWQLQEQKRILPCDYAEFGGIGGFYMAKLLKV